MAIAIAGVADWNRSEMVERWRERWAALANERLAELDIDARDHRSFEAQGIALEPQSQIGAPAQRIEGEGAEAADRAEMHRKIARNNGARIIANPSIALDAITHQQSTFTHRDMAKFAHRHSDGIHQFNAVMGVMRSAPDLVELGIHPFAYPRFANSKATNVVTAPNPTAPSAEPKPGTHTNLRVVREKTQDQLDLQALHRVRSRLVSRRTATINQIRAFLIEQGIAVRTGARALRNSLLAILENRQDEISPRIVPLREL